MKKVVISFLTLVVFAACMVMAAEEKAAAPAAPAAPAPAMMVKGAVAMIDAAKNAMQVKDEAGKVTDLVLTMTTIVKKAGADAKIADVKVGDKVTVAFKMEKKEGKDIHIAEKIEL